MSSKTTENRPVGRLDAGYLHALFQGAGLAIVACDPDATVVAANPAANELFGEDAAARPVHVAELFPERDRQTIRDLVTACANTHEPREGVVRIGADAEGPLEYAAFCAPILNPDGSLRGVSLWLRDITSRRRLQRNLKKNERLTYLGKLAGAVAHHYNNLLCSIATSVEYAMNMNTMTAMRRATQRTAEAVGRAAAITRQLLAFAQGDHRAGDLADLTEAVLAYFDRNEPRLASHHIRLFLDWQPIPTMSVPREQVNIILDHLVNNAIDAMPEGGTLSVTLGPHTRGHVKLSVADTGVGISPEDMEHLFEPFFTTKGVLASGQGTNAGLGLAVVYGLVSDMGGTITATNAPGHGARFDIVLPTEHEHGEERPDEQA